MANWKKTMMAAAGGAGYGEGTHWVLQIDGPNGEYAYCADAASTSTGDIYITGSLFRSNYARDIMTGKLDTDGDVTYIKSYSSSDKNDWGYGVAVDSSDVAYTCGMTENDSQGIITKLNSSAEISDDASWNTSQFWNINGICINSSDQPVVVGQWGDSPTFQDYAGIILRCNPANLDQTAQREFGTTASGSHTFTRVAVDSSDNYYVVGTNGGVGNVDINGTGTHVSLVKFNSSFALQWQREFNGGQSTSWMNVANGVAVDSSGNIYVSSWHLVGGSNYTNDTKACLTKWNSSGTLQWQRVISNADSSYIRDMGGVAVDNNDDVIIGFSANNSTYYTGFNVMKFNSSGTLQWQRQLQSTSAKDMRMMSCRCDNTSNIIVTGGINSNSGFDQDILIAKLHPDGDGTGTYSNFTYSATSNSVATSGLTSSTTTHSDANPNVNNGSLGLSSSTPSITETLQVLS